MRVCFLTNNPNLCSTSRILQSWLLLAPSRGLTGCVVGQAQGDLALWMKSHDIPFLADPMPWPSKRRPWVAFYHALKVARWAKKHRVEIIHCNEHDVYPFAKLVNRLLRLPMVCHVRFKIEREFAEWCFHGKYQPDALLWTSHQQKADSAAAVAGLVPESQQQVVHLGIDLATFGNDAELGRQFRRQHQISDEDILVGTASPLRPRKKVEDFIELISRLAAVNPDVVGMIAGGEIAGDEAYRQRIEQQIQATRLGGRLRWVGLLEPIEPFHLACDISISTSEYETFGNSVCEAMACSKPVVAYEGGSVGEVVGDAGVIVPTGDIDKLTLAVEKLTSDARLRKSLGLKSRLRVASEFSPASSLQRVLSTYQALTRK